MEEDLVRTGQQEVDQRHRERKLKEMVFNVKGTSSNRLKRFTQLVTALAVVQDGESAQVVEGPSETSSMEEMMLFMCILLIAGFGAGWIVKDCVVMFILSFMNRFPHQPEVIEAEEEAEDVEEEIEEIPERTDEEPRGSEEPRSALLSLTKRTST